MELLCSFEGGCDHLAQNRLLFLEVGQLLLEVVIFLLLVDHPQLQAAVEGLHKRGRGFYYLLVYVLDFGLHRVEFLPVQLDEFVVLLEIFVGFPGQILGRERGTSQRVRWPVA